MSGKAIRETLGFLAVVAVTLSTCSRGAIEVIGSARR